MKKFIPFMLCVVIAMACNNSADTSKTKDSTNVNVNTGTMPGHDTSSYERMSNKTTDSTQQ